MDHQVLMVVCLVICTQVNAFQSVSVCRQIYGKLSNIGGNSNCSISSGLDELTSELVEFW